MNQAIIKILRLISHQMYFLPMTTSILNLNFNYLNAFLIHQVIAQAEYFECYKKCVCFFNKYVAPNHQFISIWVIYLSWLNKFMKVSNSLKILKWFKFDFIQFEIYWITITRLCINKNLNLEIFEIEDK